MCTVRRAHVLVYKGKAEVIERLDKPLRSSTGSFIWPHVIRLIHYVRVMGDVTIAQARLDAMFGSNVARVEYGEPIRPGLAQALTCLGERPYA